MDSTKISELHPVEILILVFFAVVEAIITLCTITPKLWKSKDSATTLQLKKLPTNLKSVTSAPEKSQPQSVSTSSQPATVDLVSANTNAPSTRSVSSPRSRPLRQQRSSTSSGKKPNKLNYLTSLQA